MAFSLSGLLVLHGHDMAVRAELHIERALRTVKHRIPLDLGQIFHGFPQWGQVVYSASCTQLAKPPMVFTSWQAAP